MHSHWIHRLDKTVPESALGSQLTLISAVVAACWIELIDQKTLSWKFCAFHSFVMTYQSFFFPCDITMRTTNFVIFKIILFTKFLIPAFASSTVMFSLRLNSRLKLCVSMKVFLIFLISESVPSRFESGSLYEDVQDWTIIFCEKNAEK